jgi:hypothetical protein
MTLSREEDAELQRLGLFEKHGLLRGDDERKYYDLRARDRRAEVREPTGPEWGVFV